MDNQFLYKNRSAAACLSAAYTLIATNAKLFFKKSWLALLLASAVAGALLLVAPNPLEMRVLAADKSLINGVKVVMYLLPLLAIYIWLSVTDGISASLLSPLKTGKCLKRSAWSTLLVLLGWIPGCLTAGLAIIPTSFSSWHYLLTPDSKLKSVYGKPYLTGWRYFGMLFTLELLLIIIQTVLILLICMPMIILMLAQQQNELGVLLGDDNGMPAFWPLGMLVVSVLCLFLASLVRMWANMASMYAAGSIMTSQKEIQSNKEA